MRFIGAPQEHEDNLQYIYKETKTVVFASVLWASVLQCIRPLRWLFRSQKTSELKVNVKKILLSKNFEKKVKKFLTFCG